VQRAIVRRFDVHASVLRPADQRGLDATAVLVDLLRAATPTVPASLHSAAPN
jgi:hypothetical protein